VSASCTTRNAVCSTSAAYAAPSPCTSISTAIPRWSPPSLAEVTPADVERFFAPLGTHELGLAPAHATSEVPW
ncbi:hypothetical protein ACWCYZ_22650, partial [Streptomyces virginiae]